LGIVGDPAGLIAPAMTTKIERRDGFAALYLYPSLYSGVVERE
jgi:hypothetical protein